MDRQKLIYGGAAFLAILVLMVAGYFVYNAGRKSALPPPPEGGALVEDVPSPTKEEVPGNIVVPEVGAAVSEDIAPLETVKPTAPGAKTVIRTFSVNIEDGNFIPENVVVYAGDSARINFTAVDRDYDIVQPDNGYRLVIPKGATKFLEGYFPTPGKFTAYCEACGGVEKGHLGYFVVVPKQ